MTAALAFAGLFAFWLLICWRVAVERGWVGVTDEQRRALAWASAVWRLVAAMRERLEPAVRAMARAILDADGSARELNRRLAAAGAHLAPWEGEADSDPDGGR